MKPAVIFLWWISLAGTAGAFIPNLVMWLIRTHNAARRIEQYTAEILAAADGIVGNTARAAALKDTLELTPRLVEGTEAMERHTESLAASLAHRHRAQGLEPRGEEMR